MSERTDHADHASRYVVPTSGPGRAMLGFFNSVVAGLTKAGISVMGSRVLYVRGRTSGQWRTTPVNLLRHEGKSYLVAPRGHTQWVRNMRVAGGGELHVGRRVEKFTATELADADKPEIIKAFLDRFASQVQRFFEVPAGSPADAFRATASRTPVFELVAGA